MDQKTAQTVVVSEEKPRRRRSPIKLSAKSGLIVFFVGLLIILIGWRLYEVHANKTIVIGDTRITQTEIKAYATEIQRYSAAEHESFGGTPTQVADNDLILNAALKDQANKHHIALTQTETDAALQYKYNAYGSKQAYQAALRNLSIVNIMKIRDQNIAYESILQNVLIAKKQIFMVGIYYDSPYFGKSQDPAALRAQATKILQTKYLPLFKQHLSRQAIDKQVTVGTLTPNTNTTPAQSQLFFTSMPVTDMYIPNYSAANSTFNESGNNQVPGVKSANQAVNSLNKVGEYTPVETFKAGFIGIISLQAQTKGAYSSWNQLTQQYKVKYAKGLAFGQTIYRTVSKLATIFTRPFMSFLHLVSSQIVPNVYAAGAGTTCNANGGAAAHYATFYIRAFDVTTGANIESGAGQLSGAYVQETRSDASTQGGLACPNKNGVVVDADNPNQGYTSLNNLVFEDNCWNVAPGWSQSPPSGYTWDPGADYSSNIGLDENSGDSNYGWPNWGAGNINTVGNINLELAYKPPAISWQLSGGTGGGPATVAPGQSVNFSNYVVNDGPSTANYYWHVQGSYGGGPGSYADIGGHNGTVSTPSGQTNPSDTNSLVPWPNNTGARDGSTYCERIVYTNASGPGTGSSTSGAVCLTLSRPTSPVITCNSTFIPEATSDQQGNNINIPPGSPSDNSATNPDSWSNPLPPKATDTDTTGAYITISGTNASPGGYWQGETLNPTTDYSPYTANYVPSNPTITVTVNYYENALTHLGGREWTLIGTNSTTLTCLTPTANNSGGGCSLSVSGGDGPGGVFTVGQSVSVSGAIYNPAGPDNIPLPPSNGNGNLNLNFNGGQYDWGSAIPLNGSSGPFSLGSIAANGGPNPSYQTITATPAYGGTLFPGACSITFPVYAPFTLTPNASVTLAPDPEDPTSVNNDTYVTEGGTTVSENVTSNLYEVPSQSSGTIPNGNTSSTGPFSPSTTTCLYQSPSPYNISGCDPSLSNGSYPPSTPLTAGDTYCATINVPATTVGSNIAYVGPQPGYSTVVGGAAASATSCPPVVNKPYFKVYGSGVASGGSFSGPADGLLADWNNNSGLYPDYDYGGGSELANLATGPIVGYASAQQSTNDVRPPADLNFANSGWSSGTCSISTGSYTPNIGGCFGSAQPLLSELGLPNPAAWPGCLPAGPGTYNCTDGTTSSPVNLTLGATTITDGQSVYLNVNGNVYINGPITYSGANAGTWNPNNVPSFILNVTGGNIYIAPGVGELDGLYVAEPNGSSGGIIYTCGQSDFTPMGGSTLYTGCNRQLTVYGGFEAQSVHMMRTYGSLRNETPTAAVPPVNITKSGKDYSSCTPIPPSWGTIACANDGSSVYNYQEYGATYSLTGVPAGSNYNLQINYQNYQGNWPPPSSLSPPYYYVVNVLVNGAVVQTLSLPSNSGSYPVTLSSLPANPSITLDWLNNGYAPPGGSSSSGTDPGFVPAPGNPTYYDPNFEINSLNLTKNGSPPSPPPGPALHQCSNNSGGWTSPRPTCAAEVFDYSPESSLSTPYTSGASTSANSAIEIYNLPPVL